MVASLLILGYDATASSNTSELRRSTAVDYHSDRQALFTARFRRAGS